MVARSRPVRHDNKQNQSDDDASSDESEVFSDNRSDSDSNTDPELDIEDSDNDDDDPDNDTSDDEGRLSREHYLAHAESLDVFQLRQKQYSDGTQERLDETHMYCWHIGVDPVQHWQWISGNGSQTQMKRSASCTHFLAGVVVSVVARTVVIAQWTSKVITIKVNDVITMVAKVKGLELDRKPKKKMYTENVAEFAHILLTTTEMTFDCGWQRLQLLFFCQLGVITASRPGALLHLRCQVITLSLIRDLEGERPQLFIFLKPDFRKRFLGKKTAYVFLILVAPWEAVG
ncbi:hypothetical protein BDV12DRAFT_201101 [Aspergillus spectabilis]